MVHFSYVVQSVDDEIDSVQKKGEITAKSFRRIFRDRDWSLESSLVYALGKASPGLAVANHNDGSTLWMSTYINDGIVWYVVGVSNSAQLPPVYSFKQRKLLSDCHFETADSRKVEALFSSYLIEDYQQLLFELFHLSQTSDRGKRSH